MQFVNAILLRAARERLGSSVHRSGVCLGRFGINIGDTVDLLVVIFGMLGKRFIAFFIVA